jgi:ribose transport system substrate-binding protein
MCVVLSLAGCSGKGAEAPSAKPGEATARSGQLQVAVIPKGLSHQFWLTVKAGAEAAAKEGNAQVVWQGPAKETEVEKQINIIEDMVSSKVSAIVMAACDETALIRPVENAIAAGIPVVTIDSGIKSDIPVSLVATDNVAGAKLAAKELARLIGGEGEVGLIPFVKGAATSEMREQGFKDGLAELPGLKLVATLYSQSDAALAMNITQDMLTSNPNIKGIFATNEPSAIGAAQAIKAAGKTGVVKLVAFDASTQELSALNEGAIQALVVQNPFKMGYDGVKAALDHLQGKQVAKRIDTGVTIITSENINTPEVQKLLNPI